MRSRLLLVLSVFAGSFVHALLPRGAFGAYDIPSRAVLTGVVASVAYLLLATLSKRLRRSR